MLPEYFIPLGGYILGMSINVAIYIPTANFPAMVDEGWQYKINIGAD
jgi:hypothetical protein